MWERKGWSRCATHPEGIIVVMLTSPSGAPYFTDNPTEITRLRMRGYALGDTRPPTVVDEQFHPADHKVDEVLAYLEEHPDDAERVLAEERTGKARTSLVGE